MEPNGSSSERIGKALKRLNMLLLVILGGAVCFAAYETVVHATPQTDTSRNLETVPSEFEYSPKDYDIYPDRDYVVYTNYACPHCAELYFGAQADGIEYTSRILLLEDGDGAFSTQRTVSAYMLKLYRTDSSTFDKMENTLFSQQVDWTGLSSEELLAWMNERSGQSWSQSDLETQLKDVKRIEQDAPQDLEFVPGVYQDGQRCDGLMYEMLEQGSTAIATHEEGLDDE